jgi:hypothetical protein
MQDLLEIILDAESIIEKEKARNLINLEILEKFAIFDRKSYSWWNEVVDVYINAKENNLDPVIVNKQDVINALQKLLSKINNPK